MILIPHKQVPCNSYIGGSLRVAAYGMLLLSNFLICQTIQSIQHFYLGLELHFKDDNYYARYPDDVYDRKWESYIFYDEDDEINTTLSVNSSNPFRLPKLIATSAVIPKNASHSWTTSLYPVNPSDKFLIYLHFAEIQDLHANDTREFDIIWDENITNPAYSPKKLQVDTLFNTLPKKCEGDSCDWEIVRTQRSTLPPLLNAMEAYKVMEFPYSETYTTDGTLIIIFQFVLLLGLILKYYH